MFGEALRPFFCTFVRRIGLITIMRAKIKHYAEDQTRQFPF